MTSSTAAAGNDSAQLGDGNDRFVWNPGDGSDTVEGQAGNDTLVFNGANINEKFVISANGSRVGLSRDVGNVVMDLSGMETLDVNTLGGVDNITVNDLTGTDVRKVKIDLGVGGAPDGQADTDTITLNATNGDDVITIVNDHGVITVKGLGADITITDFDANDRIVINGLGGDDVIARAADQRVVAVTAGDGVVAGTAIDDKADDGRQGRGTDRVIAGASVDRQQVTGFRMSDVDLRGKPGDRDRGPCTHDVDLVIAGGAGNRHGVFTPSVPRSSAT